MWRHSALWLIFLIPGLTYASNLDDPLPIRDPFPFKLLFLDQPPSGADLQPPHQVRFSINATYVNTMVATDDLVSLFTQDPSYGGMVTLNVLRTVASVEPSQTAFVVDSETLRTALQARFGITRRFQAGLEVPVLSQGAGFMDPYIDDFHQEFNLPDGGRTAFAQGQFRVGYVGDGATIYLDKAPDGPRLGDIVLSATGALLVDHNRSPALSLTMSAKVPTGDYRSLDGSGSFDYGATVQFSKRWTRSAAHAGYSFNWIGEWKLAPDLPLRDSRSLFATYAFTATPRTCLIIQVLRTDGPFPFRPGNDLGKVAMEMAGGLRHRFGPGFEMEWSFIENVDPFYNAPDIGGFLGFNFYVGGKGGAPAPPASEARDHPSSP